MGKRKDDNGRKLTWVERLDLEIAHATALEQGRPPAKIVQGFCGLGDQPPLFAATATFTAAGLALRDKRMVRAGVRMMAAFGLATLAKTLGKNNVDRTRPNEAIDKDSYRLDQGSSKDRRLRSMPSGHTAGVVSVARAAAREYPAAGLPLAAGAALIAGSQLPSRNHYFSDIVAGTAIGLAAEALAAVIVDRAEQQLAP